MIGLHTFISTRLDAIIPFTPLRCWLCDPLYRVFSSFFAVFSRSLVVFRFAGRTYASGSACGSLTP